MYTEQMMQKLYEVHRAFHRIKQRTKIDPIQQNKIMVLQFIQEEQFSMQEIAAHLRITKARVSVIVNSLIEDGMLICQPDVQDKRRKQLSLTQVGLDYLHNKQEEHTQFFKTIWQQFSEKEQALYVQLLDKTIQILQEQEKKR